MPNAPGDGAAAAAGSRAVARGRAAPPELLGWSMGLLGVLAFSLTLPMTRFAVAQIDPWFLAFGRMSIAGILAAAWLAATRAPRPSRGDLALLAWSALGIVIGFPLLSSLAMRHIPANHGAIITGLLPFATALLAALAFGERQSRRFWICAAIGSALVVGFALRGDRAGVASPVSSGNLAMLAAVAAGAVGYVAGARLTVRLGGVAAILWALVFALPLTAPVTLVLASTEPPQAGAAAWGAFAYVTLVSQVLGFFAWYNGLALGGIGRVGQVQLLQAFFTIGFAALLFGEQVSAVTWLVAAGVVATIVAGRAGDRR
jgi:drug/metabolite transporter (DMT)-like permease